MTTEERTAEHISDKLLLLYYSLRDRLTELDPVDQFKVLEQLVGHFVIDVSDSPDNAHFLLNGIHRHVGELIEAARKDAALEDDDDDDDGDDDEVRVYSIS